MASSITTRSGVQIDLQHGAGPDLAAADDLTIRDTVFAFLRLRGLPARRIAEISEVFSCRTRQVQKILQASPLIPKRPKVTHAA